MVPVDTACCLTIHCTLFSSETAPFAGPLHDRFRVEGDLRVKSDSQSGTRHTLGLQDVAQGWTEWRRAARQPSLESTHPSTISYRCNLNYRIYLGFTVRRLRLTKFPDERDDPQID